jgi:hypothetical protein
MKTKKTLFIFLLFLTTSVGFSKDIDRSTAEKVALNFFYERMNAFVNATNYDGLHIIGTKLIDNAYYVINFKEGWVLVSVNDVMVPVLGYNYTGTFPAEEQQSESFKSWMQHYADQVHFVQENNIGSGEHAEKWEKYLTDEPHELIINTKLDEVEPLLTSTWHQIYPYNLFCPVAPTGPGGHTFVGCGATAMSQIMHYWRYPVHGSGSNTYNCPPYGTLTANFEEATYEWDAMQNNINFENPWEIAEINYHAAVSVNMQFSPNFSYSNIVNIKNALSEHFNYDPGVVLYAKEGFTQEVWEDMIREDLDLFRPLFYFSTHPVWGGHFFVCDGYQDPNYFHFNFGWSGIQNGYYTLADLIGFNLQQRILKNIFPDDPDYPYIAQGTDTLTFLSGSFSDGSGPSENYPPAMDASWLISPQSENDSVSTIILTFIQFNTAISDVLRVYDGETTNAALLGEYSGEELPEKITSSGNKMLVTFSSTGTNTGFLIEYNAGAPEYSQPIQYYTEPTGTISDGSGVFSYNNSITCVFILDCPSAIKYDLEFTSFSTENDHDVVTIFDYEQNMLGEFSGSVLPELIEVESERVYVWWQTNEFIKDEGWSLNYTTLTTGIQVNKQEKTIKK